MHFETPFKIEFYFVIGTLAYLIYLRIEHHFPTMAGVNKSLVYALIFLLWPLMIVVLAEEYVQGRNEKAEQPDDKPQGDD